VYFKQLNAGISIFEGRELKIAKSRHNLLQDPNCKSATKNRMYKEKWQYVQGKVAVCTRKMEPSWLQLAARLVRF